VKVLVALDGDQIVNALVSEGGQRMLVPTDVPAGGLTVIGDDTFTVGAFGSVVRGPFILANPTDTFLVAYVVTNLADGQTQALEWHQIGDPTIDGFSLRWENPGGADLDVHARIFSV